RGVVNYVRALRECEEARRAKHTSTIDTVYNLGLFYQGQGSFVDAQHMFARALEGYADAEGDHEADIRSLREQLSVLGMDDSTSLSKVGPQHDDQSVRPIEPERRLPDGRPTIISHKSNQKGGDEARDKSVKVGIRDRLLGMIKKN
ncbi:hypothetical protein LTR95_015476, partial [Oleoguttula sp. CCFEE 5521]